jgi:hypothetical protein
VTWLTLAWVLPLGLLATLPNGAVLGSLFSSVRSALTEVAGAVGKRIFRSPVRRRPAAAANMHPGVRQPAFGVGRRMPVRLREP